MKKALLYTALMGAAVVSSSVKAVEFDGFLSAGMSIHDQKDVTYLDGITDDVSFDNDSKFGLQITADVSQDMQVVAQILAAAADDNYDLDVEWAYLDYALSENISLRLGKAKEPVFLISDYFEVGYAYPWIRPPQEVYRANPINTITGAEMLFQGEMGGVNVSFQPYIGSNSDKIPGTQGAGTFDAENFYGAALQFTGTSFTFQMSYLKTDVTTSGLVPAGALPGPGFANAATVPLLNLAASGDAELISAGVSWDVANFVGYAEYVTRDITGDVATATAGDVEGLFPDQDAFYVTLGYRMGKYLPHLTFASSESEPNNTTGFATFSSLSSVVQDSVTLGLRYELNDSAALKMEYQVVDIDFTEPANVSGGNGLFRDQQALTEDKTGLLSVAIDVIF